MADDNKHLTEGIIRKMMEKPDEPLPKEKLLQLQILTIVQRSNSQHHNITLSDGICYHYAYHAPELSSLVKSLKPWDVVRITDFLLNKIKEITTIIILKMTKVEWEGPRCNDGINEVVGSPYNVMLHVSSNPTFNVASKSSYSSSGGGSGSGSGSSNSKSSTQDAKKSGLSPSATLIRIAEITPFQRNWKIKARVTVKSELISYSNQKGSGQFLKGTLTDAKGTQIEFTAFQELSKKWYDKLQKNSVYIFSNMEVKLPQRKFATVPHTYCLAFKVDTVVEECLEDDSIVKNSYNLKTLLQVAQMPENSKADICVIIKEYAQIQSLVGKKDGKELFKRDLAVVDHSGVQMCMTLWGKMAQQYEDEYQNQPVAIITFAKVTQFQNQKTLTTDFGNSDIILNPEHDAAKELRVWWEQGGGKGEQVAVMSKMSSASGPIKRLELADIRNDPLLGTKEQPDVFDVKANIGNILATIEQPPWYIACPNVGCKRKKVTISEVGRALCDVCCKSYPTGIPMFKLKFHIYDKENKDANVNEIVNAFEPCAGKILGGKHTAQQLKDMISAEQFEEFGQAMQSTKDQEWIFRIRAKMVMLRSSSNAELEMTVTDLKPVDPVVEAVYKAEREKQKQQDQEATGNSSGSSRSMHGSQGGGGSDDNGNIEYDRTMRMPREEGDGDDARGDEDAQQEESSNLASLAAKGMQGFGGGEDGDYDL